MRRRRKVVVIAVFLLVVFLLWIFWPRPKPPYQNVPFSTENFVGFPSELVIERAEGEFDNNSMALASYVSNDEVFLGIKMWNLHYDIDPNDNEDYVNFRNLEVLAFTKKGDLELSELFLQGNSSEHTNVRIFYDQCYNLNLVYRSNDADKLIFHGVGYSNSTGFKADGFYDIHYSLSSSSLHEANLTLTLSYVRGPFGWYGTTTVSTSLKITVRE